MSEEQYDQMMGPEMNWTCGFGPSGPLECLREATFHGFKVNGDTIDSMMASCDEHRENMKAHFKHPMDSACGVVGSYFKWPENFCYIDWESELEGSIRVNVLTYTEA
jgi:hypothetical protein